MNLPRDYHLYAAITSTLLYSLGKGRASSREVFFFTRESNLLLRFRDAVIRLILRILRIFASLESIGGLRDKAELLSVSLVLSMLSSTHAIQLGCCLVWVAVQVSEVCRAVRRAKIVTFTNHVG